MGQGRRFHLKERIGAGAYGEVFLAEQASEAGFRKRVAIKLLHAKHATSQEAGRRLRDEARILGRLSHRHIVDVLDLVRLDDRWALIMDYVPGADLERVIDALAIAGESFPPVAALEVGAAIGLALDAAYSAANGEGGTLGVVHRDVKPSNVRLTTDGEVKVLDFGVARARIAERESETGMNLAGTERFMAPERIHSGTEGPAGDVYALGATLFELLTMRPLGRTPVRDVEHGEFVAEATRELRRCLRGRSVPASEVIQLVASALHSEPERRPTAIELSTRCRQLATGGGEDLAAFATRFLPRVRELVEDGHETVDTVLSEGSSGRPAATLIPAAEELDRLLPGDVGPNGSIGGGSSGSSAPVIFRTGGNRDARRRGLWLALAALLFVAASLGWMLWPQPEPMPPADPPRRDVASIVGVEPARPNPAPTPVAEPVTTPEPTRVRPRPAPRPVARPAPAPAPVASVDRAMFIAPNASAITVNCGGVTGEGTTGVRLRRFPSGTCTVVATVLGTPHTTEVVVAEVSEVRCDLTEETLSCG